MDPRPAALARRLHPSRRRRLAELERLDPAEERAALHAFYDQVHALAELHGAEAPGDQPPELPARWRSRQRNGAVLEALRAQLLADGKNVPAALMRLDLALDRLESARGAAASQDAPPHLRQMAGYHATLAALLKVKRAWVLAGASRVDEAKRQLVEVVERQPDLPIVRWEFARLIARYDKLEEAGAILQRGLPLLACQADRVAQAGAWARALDAAIERARGEGTLAELLGPLRSAVEAWQGISESRSTGADDWRVLGGLARAHATLGDVLGELGRHREAIPALRQGLARYREALPGDVAFIESVLVVAELLADQLGHARDLDEAEETLARALADWRKDRSPAARGTASRLAARHAVLRLARGDAGSLERYTEEFAGGENGPFFRLAYEAAHLSAAAGAEEALRLEHDRRLRARPEIGRAIDLANGYREMVLRQSAASEAILAPADGSPGSRLSLPREALRVDLDVALLPAGQDHEASARDLAARTRERVQEATGVRLPPFRITDAVARGCYRLRAWPRELEGGPLARGQRVLLLHPGAAAPSWLGAPALDAELWRPRVALRLTRTQAWVAQLLLTRAGELLDPARYVFRAFEELVRRDAGPALARSELQRLLEEQGLAQAGDPLARARSQSERHLTPLLRLARLLLVEGVPLTNLRAIYPVFLRGWERGEPLEAIEAAVRRHPDVRPRLRGREMDRTPFRLPVATEHELARDGVEAEHARLIDAAVRDRHDGPTVLLVLLEQLRPLLRSALVAAGNDLPTLTVDEADPQQVFRARELRVALPVRRATVGETPSSSPPEHRVGDDPALRQPLAQLADELDLPATALADGRLALPEDPPAARAAALIRARRELVAQLPLAWWRAQTAGLSPRPSASLLRRSTAEASGFGLGRAVGAEAAQQAAVALARGADPVLAAELLLAQRRSHELVVEAGDAAHKAFEVKLDASGGAAWRQDLYQRTGVWCPPVRLRYEAGLPADGWRPLIGAVGLSPAPLRVIDTPSVQLQRALEPEMAAFLCLVQLELLLARLAESHWTLVTHLLERVPLGPLVGWLRRLLRDGRSIRDLHRIADALLVLDEPLEETAVFAALAGAANPVPG